MNMTKTPTSTSPEMKERYGRHKIANEEAKYSLLEMSHSQTAYGWKGNEAVRKSHELPKVHRNYEKPTLKEIDRTQSQKFLQVLGAHSNHTDKNYRANLIVGENIRDMRKRIKYQIERKKLTDLVKSKSKTSIKSDTLRINNDLQLKEQQVQSVQDQATKRMKIVSIRRAEMPDLSDYSVESTLPRRALQLDLDGGSGSTLDPFLVSARATSNNSRSNMYKQQLNRDVGDYQQATNIGYGHQTTTNGMKELKNFYNRASSEVRLAIPTKRRQPPAVLAQSKLCTNS